MGTIVYQERIMQEKIIVDVNLNAHTFGNTACAENLASMLNEINDKRLSRKVGAFFQEKNSLLKSIFEIEDVRLRHYVLKLFIHDLEEQKLEMPKKVYTHAVNVVVARSREMLRTKE